MGQRAAKRRKFLEAHPFCFFCGQRSETIDHVPNRECFDNRVWPEGYEFPACERCNRAAGQNEQAVAFYLHMTNFDRNTVTDQAKKLHRGVINNTPEMLPSLDVTANDRRRTFRRFGLVKPDGIPWNDVPVIKVPPA
jgi:hypothetical protein